MARESREILTFVIAAIVIFVAKQKGRTGRCSPFTIKRSEQPVNIPMKGANRLC